MAQPAQPKFDMKMLVMPAMMLLNKQVDFTKPEIVQYAQVGFFSVVVLALSIYGFVYLRSTSASSSADKKTIWIPPKTAPQLPFGLSPAPEPTKPADFKKTTFKDHEFDLLKEAVTQLMVTVGISTFIGYKFKAYFSFLVQVIMIPMGLYENILIKKYVFGVKKNADGTSLYGEFLKEPTEEMIAQAEIVKNNLRNGVTADTPIEAVAAPAEDIDKDEKKTTEVASSSSAKKSTAAAAAASSSDESKKSLNELD